MDVLSDLTFQLPDKEVVAVVAVEDSATAVVVVVSETVAAVASTPLRKVPSNLTQAQRQPSERTEASVIESK